VIRETKKVNSVWTDACYNREPMPMTAQDLIDKLKQERDQLSATIALLERIKGATSYLPQNITATKPKASHKMSEATKAKLRRIMKAKWEAKKKSAKKG
jgi:hypothetical protein